MNSFHFLPLPWAGEGWGEGENPLPYCCAASSLFNDASAYFMFSRAFS